MWLPLASINCVVWSSPFSPLAPIIWGRESFDKHVGYLEFSSNLPRTSYSPEFKTRTSLSNTPSLARIAVALLTSPQYTCIGICGILFLASSRFGLSRRTIFGASRQVIWRTR